MADFYKRVLLKLSGEMLGGGASGINPQVLDETVSEICDLAQNGVGIGLVVGGGNIFRGLAGATSGMDRGKADHMGMLATAINALALSDSFERHGQQAVVMSALNLDEIAQPFSQDQANRLISKGVIVIFASGTGNPYFSTDTGAALRALQIHADVLLKGTKVKGVFDSDPVKNPEAKFFSQISFDQVIEQRLGVMDTTAFALCRDNSLPIRVFDATKSGNLIKAAQGLTGTVISH